MAWKWTPPDMGKPEVIPPEECVVIAIAFHEVYMPDSPNRPMAALGLMSTYTEERWGIIKAWVRSLPATETTSAALGLSSSELASSSPRNPR